MVASCEQPWVKSEKPPQPRRGNGALARLPRFDVRDDDFCGWESCKCLRAGASSFSRAAVVQTHPLFLSRWVCIIAIEHMFLKETTRCKDGKEHHYWSLWRTGVWMAGARWCSGMCSIWARSIPASRRPGARPSRFSSPAPTGRERWLCFPKNALRRSTTKR